MTRRNQPEQIRLTAEHEIILAQLKKLDGSHLTSDDLQTLTNIEPIKISAILVDLVSHGLVHQIKSDERMGYWVYTLSDHGKKFVPGQNEQPFAGGNQIKTEH